MSPPAGVAPLQADSTPASLVYRSLRAPAEDGGLLFEPPWDQAAELLAAGRARRGQYACDVQGMSLAQLSSEARESLLAEAYRYTSAYRDVPRPTGAQRIVLAGHQPQMFHPGVWFKNIALSRLAQDTQSAAINLVIDADTLKQAALRVPEGDADRPASRLVAYDESAPEAPYEQRRIQDAQTWATFGERAAGCLENLVPEPLLRRYWPLVLERSRETDNLGACLSQARHQLEGQWGVQTLELPQSRVCQLPAFYWFVAHLLAHAPRLRQVHNDAVREYRRLHHIRSELHPVPELAEHDGAVEAPFWILDDSSPKRRRLFVAARGRELVLMDRAGSEWRIPLSQDRDAGQAAPALADLASRGVHLRTRALTTTLFARLFLSDLFLHGIGGGKYDQLTDLIVERFFRLRPPPWMIVSATLRLPVARSDARASDLRQIDDELRRLTWQPERFLSEGAPTPPAAEAETWIAAKQRWIATSPEGESAAARYREIRRANQALQAWVEPIRQDRLQRRERLTEQLRANQVLAWREYAFCLYPEERLRKFMLAFLLDGS